MSPVKWLDKLIFIESLLGTYRNYCDQTKIKKRFIIFQTFLQIILHLIVVIGEMELLFGGDTYNLLNYIFAGYYFFACVSSMSYVITGICSSRAFTSYYESISRVSESFNDSKTFVKSFKTIIVVSIILILSNIVIAVLKSVEVAIGLSPSNPYFLSTIFVSQTILRLNIAFQHLILFAVLLLVVHSFKSLTSLVSAAQERVGRCEISSDEQCDITREQIHEWVDLYTDLANCCEKLTLCFGRQFFFTLTISTTTYVIIVFKIFHNMALKGEDNDGFKKTAFIICLYSLLMVMPIVAGQLARNQGVKFHRILARLYNSRIIDSHEAKVKLIKDFIRVIKKNPIEIKLLPKIPAGMYMLPVILSLAVNYIIVMLQLNHII